MDCICLRRKHRKKRQHSKFRHLTPPVSPVHSQPSSIGTNPQAKLPKVNKSGLWLGAPSMYTGGPAPAYYMGRGIPGTSKFQNDPHMVPRASSDTRLGQAVPSQGGQRIFHSQQLTPVFEMPARNGGMDIYDVYQFGAGVSKSKLAETRHTKSYYDDGFILQPRLERSKSDVGEKSRPSRRTSEKSRQPSNHTRSSSNEGRRHRSSSRGSSDNRLTSQHGSGSTGSKSAGSFIEGRVVSRHASQKSQVIGQNNRAYSADAEVASSVYSSIKEEDLLKQPMSSANRKPPVPTSSVATVATVTNSTSLMNGTPGIVSVLVDDRRNMDPLATDSMKLLAKNKTDDQKTIVPHTQDLILNTESDQNALDKKNVGYQHYIYHGDIYAVSGNRKLIDEEEGNPIISRMKDMVIEKSRNNNSPTQDKSQSTPDTDTYNNTNSDVPKDNSDSIYEEIKIDKTENGTKTIAVTPDAVDHKEGESNRPRATKLANPADLSILDGIELPPASDLGNYSDLDISNNTSDAVRSYPWHMEETQPTSPVSMRAKNTSLKNKDDNVEGATEEISTAGKRITDSAFEFLNTYLSDDDCADGQIDSPPLSPSS